MTAFDFNFDSTGKLEFHQSVYGAGCRAVDVEETTVGIKLELLARLLVDEGRTVHGEYLLVCRKGDRTIHDSTGSLHRFHDLVCGLVHESVIE